MTASAGVQRSLLIGHVYFVQSGDRPLIKIGWAIDPVERLQRLQCGNPDELRLLATLPGSMADELSWRRHFAALQIRGEWFALSEELAAAIRRGQHVGPSAADSPPAARNGRPWNTCLDEGKVRAIRADRRAVRTIAAAYGVSKTCVQDIRMRRTWRHVA